LQGMDQEDVQTALGVLIETYAARGEPAEVMRALSRLAEHLDVETPAMWVYLQTPLSAPAITVAPSPTSSPTLIPLIPTSTPAPTATPFYSPLPVPSPYRVISRTLVCEATTPQLQVFVRSAPEEDGEEGKPLPGLALWLTWSSGADRAVTGLRPQIDLGYADFDLSPDLSYALSIGEPGAPVLSGLTVEGCPGEDGAESYPGSWRVAVEVQE